MEILLYIILISMLGASLRLNFVLRRSFREFRLDTINGHENLERAINEQKKKYDRTQDIIENVGSDLQRSMLALRDSLETTKPMKSNNWDSVREAFKGPVRIEVNERN